MLNSTEFGLEIQKIISVYRQHRIKAILKTDIKKHKRRERRGSKVQSNFVLFLIIDSVSQSIITK